MVPHKGGQRLSVVPSRSGAPAQTLDAGDSGGWLTTGNAAWPGCADVVLLATTGNFPDALAAGALGAGPDAPISHIPTGTHPHPSRPSSARTAATSATPT
jgi:hypothetical protein